MLGMVDDDTLILKLYPLKENAPSGDDQKKKVLEMGQGDVITEESQKEKMNEVNEETMQAGDGNQDEKVPSPQSFMFIESLHLWCSKHHPEIFSN